MSRARTMAALGLLAVAAAVTGLVVGSGSGSGGSGGSDGQRSPQPAGSSTTATAAEHADWRPYTGPVPILEYHPIQPPTPGAAYPQLFVPQAAFTGQMEWLAHHGYEGVTLNRVEDAWYRGGKLPPKPVVISFDDGYESQYVAAFPLLQKLGWPGVLDLKAAGSDLADADAQKMVDAGWELASHTINHLDVTTLDQAQLEREIAGSRRILQRRFGVRVDNFCYPAGRYDAAAIAELRSGGYRGATTENFGLADRSQPFTLDRIEVELSDGVSGFVQKLQSAQAG